MDRDEFIRHINAPPNPIFDSPLLQRFSFPFTLLRYIAESSKMIKLYQTCKIFYSKYPFVKFKDLEFFEFNHCGPKSIWKVQSMKSAHHAIYEFYLKDLKYKIWLTNSLSLCFPLSFNILSSLCKKLLRCDVTRLTLQKQIISFNEFLFLTSSKNLERVYFKNITVTNNDGSIVQLERIFSNLSIIKSFYYGHENHLTVNDNTAKAIADLPKFENLRNFGFCLIPDGFALNIFLNFIKKHENTSFFLDFRDDLSESFKAIISEQVDILIETDFKPPPAILFPGHNGRYGKLCMMKNRYKLFY